MIPSLSAQSAPSYAPIKSSNSTNRPCIEIIEEPAPKSLRFRYECEGRSAGSIPGINSTPEHKTYPTIKIAGYKGKVIVVVSCVTKDKPYRAHPHKLVGREDCKDGIFTTQVDSDDMIVTFQNVGIQCVKKRDIDEALTVREKRRMDPFGNGFQHKNQPNSIDLNCVRLCFQAFIPNGVEPNSYHVLQPVVSQPICDKKAMSDLIIVRLSQPSATVKGGVEMQLLCEKVAKEDIAVRFFELENNEVVWEANADFPPSQVHKQCAIWFKTPKYRNQDIQNKVKAYIQLKRPSDGACSEPVEFYFTPDNSVTCPSKRKKVESSFIEMANMQGPYSPNQQILIKTEPPNGHGSPNYFPSVHSPVGPSLSPIYVRVPDCSPISVYTSSTAYPNPGSVPTAAASITPNQYLVPEVLDQQPNDGGGMPPFMTNITEWGNPDIEFDSLTYGSGAPLAVQQRDEGGLANEAVPTDQVTSLEIKLDTGDLVRPYDTMSRNFSDVLHISEMSVSSEPIMDDSLNRLVNEKAQEICE